MNQLNITDVGEAKNPLTLTNVGEADLGMVSFDEIYRKYYRKVCSIVNRYRFTDGAADDLIQDIFIQAWRCLGSLRDDSSLGGWISCIAKNMCLNEIRKNKPTVSISGTDEFNSDDSHVSIVLAAKDQQATANYEYSASLLTSLIQTQKDSNRARVAKLFYLENIPVRKISIKLGLKQNTVLSHLRRFRSEISIKMNDLMEQSGFEFATVH